MTKTERKTRRQFLEGTFADFGSEPLNPPVVIKRRGKEVFVWLDADGLWIVPRKGYKGVEAVFTPFNTLIAEHLEDAAKEAA